MNAIVHFHPELARKWAEQEKVEQTASRNLVIEAGRAIERLAGALQHPRIARNDLIAARAHLNAALALAEILDPE